MRLAAVAAVVCVAGQLGTGIALGNAARHWLDSTVPGAAAIDGAKTPQDRRKAMENMAGLTASPTRKAQP